jgi:cellulose synthase operon protein C
MNKTTLYLTLISAIALATTACKNSESPEALLASAKSALEKNDPKAAEIHLKNVLQKQDTVEARSMLGKLYSETGDFQSSEKELRRAIEMGASRNEFVPILLQAMYQSGNYQKIIDDSQNLAVTDKAAKAAVATVVGKAQVAVGKSEQAQSTFKNALLDSPNFIPLQVGLLSLQVGKGEKKEANAELDELIKRDPNAVDAYVLKGDLELAEGNLGAAKSIYIKVAQLAPSNALARAKLTAIFIDSNEFKLAEEQINELQKVSPNSPGTLYLRALLNFRQNKIEAARDFVLLSLKGAPEYLPSITLAGTIYLTLGSFESAERYSRMVIERAPTALQGYRLLGATYLKMNAPERALQTVLPLIDKGVKDSTIFSIAGESSLKVNDAVKASIYFENASKLDPKDPTKRTGLALSRMASGDRDKAFAELEEAVLLDTQNYQADFALIMARVRDKQFDKAKEAVVRLEKKIPKSPIPANLNGLIALAQNDLALAKKSFESALAIDPVFFAAAANIASIELKTGNPDAAKKQFENILKADPKNAQAYIALARHVQRTGGTNKEAIEYLKKAKAANSNAIPPVIALASFYLEINEPKDAVPLLQEALSGTPDNQELLDLLGTSFLRMNDRAKAIEAYEKLLNLNPKSAATHYRLGEIRLQSKDDTAAMQSFKRAAELQPTAPEPKIAIATILVRQGKINEAKQIAIELKKDLPDSAIGLALEGDLATVNNQHLEAAAAYRKALAVERQVAIGVKLHKALQSADKKQDAQILLDEWFKGTPNDITMRLYAGEQELTQGKWKLAIENYNFVLKQDSNHAIALNNSAWAFHKLGDKVKAVELAERAYSVAQSSPPIIDTLGVILVENGNTTRGIELLKQAVSLAPKQIEYRLHLAEGFFKSGDAVSTKKELELIMKDEPKGAILDGAKALARRL